MSRPKQLPKGMSRADVPFLDLGPIHAPLRDAILAEIGDLFDSGQFTNGPHVAAFERSFAAFCGTRHCVGTGSGLDALRFALLACGVERGDEVIVPATTFVATFEAVTQAGAVPVVTDVSADDYNLDVRAAAAAISPRTRVLLPVHLYGQMADMLALAALAERRGLAVVEDACQAHGATRDGVAAGQAGTAAAFSFYPGKNLGAAGDAGALVTDDPQIASMCALLREHGQAKKYDHEVEGYTSRLDTLQALFLLRKLPYLEQWNGERRAIANAYRERLDGVGDLVLPPVPPGSEPVWHLFVIRTSSPADLQAFLAGRGIGSGRHYPSPPHLTRAYAWLGLGVGAFPVSESLCREALSLPIFPGMTEVQVEAVVEAVADFFVHR